MSDLLDPRREQLRRDWRTAIPPLQVFVKGLLVDQDMSPAAVMLALAEVAGGMLAISRGVPGITREGSERMLELLIETLTAAAKER
jgi:hypothetical protein